jgi:hypothetical protein
MFRRQQDAGADYDAVTRGRCQFARDGRSGGVIGQYEAMVGLPSPIAYLSQDVRNAGMNLLSSHAWR